MPEARPTCVVCNKFAPLLYGGFEDLPICRRCYDTGALAEWLHEHPDRDPDGPHTRQAPPALCDTVREIAAEFVIVGHESDGPLEKCVPLYRKQSEPMSSYRDFYRKHYEYDGGVFTKPDIVDAMTKAYAAKMARDVGGQP